MLKELCWLNCGFPHTLFSHSSTLVILVLKQDEEMADRDAAARGLESSVERRLHSTVSSIQGLNP
jgi:hypothetical protein